MRNVWVTQHRLYREELEAITDRVSHNRRIAPAVAEKQIVQLLATVAMLLQQHDVNNRGQCDFCGWTRWGWRWWRRRPRCTVFRAVSFALGQPLDVVWWQVFEIFDRNTSLEEVRQWVEQRWRGDPAPGADERDADAWSTSLPMSRATEEPVT